MTLLGYICILLAAVAACGWYVAWRESRAFHAEQDARIEKQLKIFKLQHTLNLFAGSPLALVADDDGRLYSWNDSALRWDPVFYSAGGQMMSMGIGDISVPFRFATDREKESREWKERLPREAYEHRTNRDARSRRTKTRWYPTLIGEVDVPGDVRADDGVVSQFDNLENQL